MKKPKNSTKVRMSVGEVQVQKEQTAPRFVIRNSGGKIGELIVSRGGVRWLSKGLQEDAYHAGWRQFDAWMKTQSRR